MLCVRNHIVSCVSALLAIAVIGSWRFDRLALGIRLHQFSKVGIAFYQHELPLLKAARSSTRYRRSISPVAAPDLAVAIRCWYEHDEERISGFIKGWDGLRLGRERPDPAIARSSDADRGLNNRRLQRLSMGPRSVDNFGALWLAQNRSCFEQSKLADAILHR